MSGGRRRIGPIVSATLIAAGLLAPLIILGAHHLTLTGMTEESTGYRYFYTLRMLYGHGERPWLPQGQLPGLSHLAIQLALTLSGFSPTSLFPRIDLFAYSAAALPHVLAIVAFLWLADALPAGSELTVSGLAVLIFLIGGSAWYRSTTSTLVEPDYMSWAEPIALITTGWLLRLQLDVDRERWTNDVLIGVFGGLCLSIKPTYAVFVLPIAITGACLTTPIWRGFLKIVSSALVGAATWIVITWAYYLTDVHATLSHFSQLTAFVASIPAAPSLSSGFTRPELWGSSWTTVMVVAVPLTLAASLVWLPRRSLSAGLLAGSLASLYVVARRFESQTLVETNAYILTAGLVWAIAIVGPALKIDGRWPGLRRTTMFAITAAVWLLAGRQLYAITNSMLPAFETADMGARALARCLVTTPGRTLFLIPDNNFRPTTVDSAIFKGGSDIYRYRWGVSKYVQEMFPDRGYAAETSGAIAQTELDTYSKIVFVSLPGARGTDVERLKNKFTVPVEQFDCSCTIDFKYHIVNACHRP